MTDILSLFPQLIWALIAGALIIVSELKRYPLPQYDPLLSILGLRLLSIGFRMWFFAVPYAVLLEGKSIFQSIRFSFKIVRNRWFLVLVALLMYATISVLPSLIAWQTGETSQSIKSVLTALDLFIAPIQVYVYLLLFKAINPQSTPTEQTASVSGLG